MRVLLVAVLVTLAGCAGGGASPFAGTVWTLDRIVTATGDVTRGSGDERLTFGADGRLLLESCNQCNGPYRLRTDALVVGEAVACTRRGCPDGQIEMERYVRGTVGLRREGSYLVLTAPDAAGGETQLVFAQETAPPVAP